MKTIIQLKYLFFAVIIVFGFYACANRAQGPEGGPKDVTPPSVIKSFPTNKAVNVNREKVEIIFDENVNLQKISENVIISPPQINAPDVKSYGKSVTVKLNDTLQANTTYSINFGDAIVDNNENNVLKNYVFSFATGNEIDTLQIAGTLINAENLNPIKGVTVGIYTDLSDTAFTSKPFMRITRTDENGHFAVPNVHAGRYKVYALSDVDRNNYYQPGEDLAFNDSVYTPSFSFYQKQDTVWKDTVTIDTIKTVQATKFLPDNILLRHFKEINKRQYLLKSERTEANHFSLFFNAPNSDLPKIEPLNVNFENKILLQKNQNLDSLTYWLTDSSLIKKDTILLKITYLKSDSLLQLKPQTDTLTLSMKKDRGKISTKTVSTKAKKEFLPIRANLTSKFEVYNPVILSFDTPLKTWDTSKIHLSQLKDTVLIPLKFSLEKIDSIGLSFLIRQKWIPETTYQLQIDSAAFYNVYNLHNDKFKNELKIKSLDDYSGMKLFLEKFDSTAVFQIINTKDEVVKTAPAKKNGTIIQYLTPGDYYIRMFLDKNLNGSWTTGSYAEKRQPEEVFYYPKKLTLIKNWEFEETWNPFKTPLLQQKPKELKPKTESQNNSQSGRNNNNY